MGIGGWEVVWIGWKMFMCYSNTTCIITSNKSLTPGMFTPVSCHSKRFSIFDRMCVHSSGDTLFFFALTLHVVSRRCGRQRINTDFCLGLGGIETLREKEREQMLESESELVSKKGEDMLVSD